MSRGVNIRIREEHRSFRERNDQRRYLYAHCTLVARVHTCSRRDRRHRRCKLFVDNASRGGGEKNVVVQFCMRIRHGTRGLRIADSCIDRAKKTRKKKKKTGNLILIDRVCVSTLFKVDSLEYTFSPTSYVLL